MRDKVRKGSVARLSGRYYKVIRSAHNIVLLREMTIPVPEKDIEVDIKRLPEHVDFRLINLVRIHVDKVLIQELHNALYKWRDFVINIKDSKKDEFDECEKERPTLFYAYNKYAGINIYIVGKPEWKHPEANMGAQIKVISLLPEVE